MLATSLEAAPKTLRDRLRWLAPLDNGPQEIRAMDGLRAIAALSVLMFHTVASFHARQAIFGLDISFLFIYLASGVHLFFVLSGFLLFMPYARALLSGRPLPDARSFYRRRALRILPAYYVCLAVFTVIGVLQGMPGIDVGDVAAHVLLLHDYFPPYSRSIVGVFWTLAIEWQFYLLLPWIARGIARLMGGSHSLGRLVAILVGFMALAVCWREGVALAVVRLPHIQNTTLAAAGHALVLLCGGSQGKYLEVFAIGMLCGTLYVARREVTLRMRGIGAGLVGFGVVLGVLLAELNVRNRFTVLDAYLLFWHPRDLAVICGPLLVGLSYGAVVLGVLWSGRLIRAPFEVYPLRFVGFISYSLYLWHSPLIGYLMPVMAAWSTLIHVVALLAFDLLVIIPFAYLLYLTIERPFLKLRRRVPHASASASEAAVVGPPLVSSQMH